MEWTRRDLLVTAGALAVAGCSDGDSAATPTTDATTATDDDPFASVPIPEDPSSTYARAGAGDPTVTYVGNWKCPFCAMFATGEADRPVLPLGEIVTEYVVPGDVTLAYRGLAYGGDGDPFLGPDAPRATRFGLAVWHEAPTAYWRYHEQVMANQPPESEQWATLERLAGFAREAGVADDAVAAARQRTADGTDASAVEATTSYAAEAGVSGTPTLVIDGGTYSPFEPETTRDALASLTD